jgi:hypothetical protein
MIQQQDYNELVVFDEASYVFYDCALDYLEEVATDLSNSLPVLGNAWTTASSSEILELLKVALKLYFFNTHQSTLMNCKRAVPPREKLEFLTANICVPRFVRDIIREICRPMTSGGTVYLPNILYADLGPEVRLIDSLGAVKILPKWNFIMNKCGYELVELGRETPRASPLSFAILEKSELFSVLPLPEWRLEAFTRTRHLVHQPSGVQRSEQPPEHTVTEPYNDEIVGRYAGSLSGFLYSYANITRSYGYFRADFRFPSNDERSMTPPRPSASNGSAYKSRNPKNVRRKSLFQEVKSEVSKE